MGWAVGDIIALSRLAVEVHTAYKNGPKNYRHICEEVKSLQPMINKAEHHFKSPTLTDNNRHQGQEVLSGCRSVLEDMNSLIEKYNSLGTTTNNTYQVFRKIRLGVADIGTLRARLMVNIGLLNSFIQRFDILTTTIRYGMMLISLL